MQDKWLNLLYLRKYCKENKDGKEKGSGTTGGTKKAQSIKGDERKQHSAPPLQLKQECFVSQQMFLFLPLCSLKPLLL